MSAIRSVIDFLESLVERGFQENSYPNLMAWGCICLAIFVYLSGTKRLSNAARITMGEPMAMQINP